MMTLKHISPDGHEDVVSLVSVSFDPETKTLIGHRPNDNIPWTTGRAFLMNEHGKTVAVYHLSK